MMSAKTRRREEKSNANEKAESGPDDRSGTATTSGERPRLAAFTCKRERLDSLPPRHEPAVRVTSAFLFAPWRLCAHHLVAAGTNSRRRHERPTKPHSIEYPYSSRNGCRRSRYGISASR